MGQLTQGASQTAPATGAAGVADAVRLLRTRFGYDEFRGAQEQIIEHLLAGGDALVLMPTGGG
ncbi:MAG: hypothetical protein WDA03_08835, partial [Trueperaceae bacterium]